MTKNCSVVGNVKKNNLVVEKRQGRRFIMDLLKDLLQDGEKIATYGLTGSYSNFNCIIEEGSDDIGGALEDTLRRIIEIGEEESLYSIMGAFVPTDEEMEEMEEFDEYVSIDLGYILGGLITVWEEN